MSTFLQRLLKREGNNSRTPPEASPEPYGAANALDTGDDLQREYEVFCQTFYFRPGEKLMDFIKANNIYRLQEWLDPKTEEPEPKAFIKLANESTRQGIEVWKQSGLSVDYEGAWSRGGGPSQRSRECLSVLAQILEMPIKVYYKPTEDGDLMVLEFGP